MSSKLIQALKGLTREGISKLSEATTRLDDWQNRVTGFGTSIDKTTYTQYVGGIRLSDVALSNLYHGDDLAARMIDIVPDELLREGFTVETGDVGLNAELSEQFEVLGIDGKLADGWRWGRLYGGAALLLGADDGRSAATPLVAEKAKALNFVHVVDRRYLWPLTHYRDPTSPKRGLPETYMVSASSSHVEGQGFSVVHESRLVLFGGATTGTLEREQNNSWDHSVLQRALQPLAAFNTGWKAVELLLTDANQAVFKMNGLSEVLGANGEETVKNRMKMVDLFRSVMRAIVVDAGDAASGISPEEFTRQTVSFADIPQTLDKFMLRLAAAVQIPVTILMGQSPAGMSATGDSDFRWFYDRIRSEQTRKLAPKIRRIVKVMLATKAFNTNPERVEVKFPALWTETPSAQATTRKTLLEGDAIATTNGFLVASEVAAKRFGEPNGFDSEIQLTDEGKKAREAENKGDLEDLSKPPEEREPPPGGGGGGFGGGGFGNFDADDQPRDDNGQFASTDGGGGGSGSGSGKGGSGDSGRPDPREQARNTRLAAVAKSRLQKAQSRHEKAKADHSEAEAKLAADKQEAHRVLDARIQEAAMHGERATKLAEEAKAELAKNKAAEKAAAKRNVELLKEAGHSAQDIEDRSYELSPLPEHAEEYKANNNFSSHEEQLKDHISELKREARASTHAVAKLEKARGAIEDGDAKTVEKLTEPGFGAPNAAARDYLIDKELRSSGFNTSRLYRAGEKPEAHSKTQDVVTARVEASLAAEVRDIPDFPDLREAAADLKSADAKVAKAERHVRLHEREVKRREGKAARSARSDADDQPRDDNGQFASTDGGGGSGAGSGKGGSGSKTEKVAAAKTAAHGALGKLRDGVQRNADRAREYAKQAEQLAAAEKAKGDALESATKGDGDAALQAVKDQNNAYIKSDEHAADARALHAEARANDKAAAKLDKANEALKSGDTKLAARIADKVGVGDFEAADHFETNTLGQAATGEAHLEYGVDTHYGEGLSVADVLSNIVDDEPRRGRK